LKLGGGEQPGAKDFARLISFVRGRPDRHLIETVMLRSLKQAIYHPDNMGHFGLALPAYTHFTSPIRRYPDLLVHRGIRHILSGKPVAEFDYTSTNMQVLGEHCSMTERRADEATRDAVDWLKCEFMMSRVGQEFPGIITTVTSFGLFVELDDIFVEGLVHVTALENDYYHFDPVKHRMVGERTGKVYRLADKIQVKVVRVDLDERKIDFVLAERDGSLHKVKTRSKKEVKTRRSVTGKKTAIRRRKRSAR
jgi:ribonuclease R